MSPETDFDVATRLAHVAPLRGVQEKTNPHRTALVVIDMENDFIADEGLIEKEGRDVSQAKEMAKRLPALITYRSFFGELSTIDELIGFWPPRNRV